MIREFSEKDLPSVIKLGKKIKEGFSNNDIGTNDRILVYELDGNVVAFLEYSQLYETADLLNIVVDDDYRQKGIGTILLEYLFKDASIERIMLEVRVNNFTAISFYKKNGFKIVRTIKNYYDGEDAYSMERSLIWKMYIF